MLLEFIHGSAEFHLRSIDLLTKGSITAPVRRRPPEVHFREGFYYGFWLSKTGTLTQASRVERRDKYKEDERRG